MWREMLESMFRSSAMTHRQGVITHQGQALERLTFMDTIITRESILFSLGRVGRH